MRSYILPSNKLDLFDKFDSMQGEYPLITIN